MAEGFVSTVIKNETFGFLSSVIVLSNGTILATDRKNCCVWKVDPRQTTLSTFAGVSGKMGYKDGPANEALFDNPAGMDTDGSSIFIADSGNNRIRKVSEGVVSTVAGNGACRVRDEDYRQASFRCPFSIVVKPDKTILVTDMRGHVVRLLRADQVLTVAGVPKSSGRKDGPCDEAKFFGPIQIALSSKGGVYVADQNNQTVRTIRNGQVQTVLGGFNSPRGVAVLGDESIYVSDSSNRIYKCKPTGEKEILCGSGEKKSVDGQGVAASLDFPQQLFLDARTSFLYFTELQAIRKVRIACSYQDPLLPQDLARLIDNSSLSSSDLATFVVEGKRIEVKSKTLLCLRSEYFNRMFASGWKEVQTCKLSGSVTIPIEDANYDAFHALITFLVTGFLDMVKCRRFMMEIAVLADRFLVPDLKNLSTDFLSKGVTMANVLEYLTSSEVHGFEDLKEACVNFAVRNMRALKREGMLHFLSKESLVRILELVQLDQ
eukprot:m.74770 g.74770  ORF g.74770 m.74770 type:complete len:490 (+) comp35917_c0_seq1:2495-3964(+)